jgi:hypothetical protein
MHLVILHYSNVTWLRIPLWIYGRTWTLWSFFSMGIPSPSYIKSLRSNTTVVQTLFMEGQSPCSMFTTRRQSGVLHHMNSLVLFRRYIRSLDTLELSILIAFSLLITIGEVCMLKSKTSLLHVNNVIEWELLSPFDSSCFLHSLYRACFIAGHVI